MLAEGQQIDKYKIISPIYSGKFSEVYYAFDQILNAYRAIKILYTDPEKIERHINEAQITNKCKHAHIVEINEANLHVLDDRNALIISMEYLPDGSVDDRMRLGFISCHDAVRYGSHILRGLCHAHANGIIHGDIKPANIMLSDNISKLSDFGLAIDYDSSLTSERADYAYMTHMAPELFNLQNPNTVATDIFAVGSTLFRISNNIFDWNDLIHNLKGHEKLLMEGKIIGKKVKYESFAPKKLKRIINKACHPDPSSRYQSAEEMKQALENLVPDICWIRENDTYWAGKRGADFFEMEIIKGRKWKVDVKRNARRDAAKCHVFNTLEEAETYLLNYVADTTFR